MSPSRPIALFFAVLLLFAVSLSPTTTRADTPPTPEAVLTQIFTASAVSPDWFTPAFLAQVPLEQIQKIVDQYKAGLGAFQSVQPSGTAYLLRFERGSARTTIHLDASGAVASLIIGVPQSNDPAAAFQSSVDAIRSLPGKVSLLVTRNGSDRIATSPDSRLAVGSAFKLAVLAALQDQIASGKHTWEEVVHLKPQWKSLPSGILQGWPDGSPLTIATLASLMISQSDNTAADALVDLVGRAAVEKYGPGNEPLLTTRELFTLKAPRLASLLERYRAGSTSQRRAMLDEVDAEPQSWLSTALTPDALDIEWFFSTRDLCSLLDKTGGLDVFSINPGVAEPTSWKSVAYKGGSEPGVLNMSHQLTGFDGTKWCVAVTWNDPAAEIDGLAPLLGMLIGSLR